MSMRMPRQVRSPLVTESTKKTICHEAAKAAKKKSGVATTEAN
jgi:hypothetical protein